MCAVCADVSYVRRADYSPADSADLSFFFFFNDTATTEIYTLSLHDALPISREPSRCLRGARPQAWTGTSFWVRACRDRKSTRLNSSHSQISYAVFCLKKKKKNQLLATRARNHTRRRYRELRQHRGLVAAT